MKNKVKRILSIAMTVCMLSTMVPLTTYGAEVEFSDDTDVAFESEEDNEETTTDAADVQIEEDEQTDDENADVSVEEDAEGSDEESEEAENELFISDDGEAGTEELFSDSVGIDIAVKPADGTTTGQPFAAGTGGSQNFRIPAMVTLSDGTIVAATDARWNTSFDGYCLDTIVSRSSDKGATWNYTFANYLGDNGNVYNTNSTAFIDPVLAVGKDDTIYMMVDLFPAGGYIGNISAGTGYNSAGYLKLSTSGNSSSSSYDYYLNGTTIYNAKTNEAISELSVDDHFNLTGTYNGTTYNTNLFFADSPFKVLKTSYLYLTKSTDGGKTWSAPTMLNAQVKNSSETFYGVGPGRGLTTTLKDGTERIILPCYTYNSGVQYTSVIYSDDHGASWTRSNSMTSQSSEATLVEADGNIYMFTRGGGYYVSSDHGATWGGRQNISGISYNTNCQINAITYSEKVDGKTVILLSAPSSTGSRTNGKIFVGLVQDDESIQWNYSCAVNNSTYQYSCMTELKDGTVALLYENGSASEYFTVYKIDTLAPGATIGTKEESESTVVDETTGVKIHFLEEKIDSASVSPVTVKEIQNDPYIAYDVVPGEGYSETSAEVTIPLNEILKGLNVKAFYVNNGKIEYVDGKKDGDNYVFTVPHFTVVGVQGSASNSSDDLITTEKVTLALNTSKTFTQDGEYSYTDSDEYVTVATEVKDKYSDPYYVSATFGTGTFYVSGTSGAANPTAMLTFEDAGNGQYYVKNANGDYIYPNATYNSYGWSGWWSYGVGTGKTAVDITVNDDGSITISKGYSRNRNSTTSYLNSALNSASSSASNIYLYSEVTPVAGKQTAITFTGTQIGITEITIGNVRYEITVVARGSNYNASVAVGDSTKITIPDTIGADEKVVWSSNDYTKAGVYSSDGQNATITGREEGTTVVTATVYDKDGNQAAVYSWNVDVTEGDAPNAGNYTVTIASENTIYNGKLYYSIAGGPLVEVPVTETTTDDEGNTIYKYEKIELTVENVKYTQLELFVKPDDGYAVTSITDTKGTSYSQFYGIDKENVQVVYSSGHQGGKLEDALTTEQEKALLSEAIANGCDAVFWYTRGTKSSNLTSNGTIDSAHVVHCDKLPTITKEVAYLQMGGEGNDYVAYQEGMVAHKGDVAVFKIDVSKYKANANIVYSNVKLTDIMPGVSGTVKIYSGVGADAKELENPWDITDALNASGTDADHCIYYVAYELQDDDLEKMITNKVSMAYDYSSTYSSGTYGGTAEADAKFAATAFPGIKDIVIDFGSPVTTEKTAGWGTPTKNFDLVGKANYGNVKVSGSSYEGISVTYTPTKVLTDVDTVTLWDAKYTDAVNAPITYTFKVYPATTVYYEESFVNGGEGATQLGAQTATEVGKAISEDQNYGRDDSYGVSGSNLKEWKTGTLELGDKGQTFTFNGTGVDIYADTEAQDDEDDHDFTGTMMIKVKDEANQLVKIVAVDTRMKNGSSKATSIQNVNGKNVPVATLELANKGEYTLTLSRVKSGSDGVHPVYLDGFRVYNTLGNSENAVYNKDGEANPAYYELRDQVISTIAGEDKNISDKYADQIATDKLGQVYAEGKVANGAMVIEKPGTSVTNIQDFVDNGPKNELYLDKNMAVTFNLTQDVQIGIKGVNGNATFRLNDESGKTVSTTDMFYKVGKGQITIENTGDTLLSITKIKAIGGVSPTSLFAPLTEESLTAALVSLGYEKAPAAKPTTKPTQKPTQQIKLATPKLGKVVSAGYNALKLNWSKVKDADGYRVFVKVNGQWKSLGDVRGTTYVHKNLETGKSYTFTVKAYKKTKAGVVWSACDEKGITGKPGLSAPSLRKAKRTSAKKATLSWKKVDGANGYVVYRKTNNGRWQIVKKITKGSTTSFTDTTLSKGKKYTYTVRAYRTVGKKNVYSGYNAKGLTVK